MHTTIISEILQFLLHGMHCLLGHTVLQPGGGPLDPHQKLRRKCKCMFKWVEKETLGRTKTSRRMFIEINKILYI